MTVHNYRSRQVHETLNGVNPSNGFRDMRSAKSGPNLCQIWQVFGPWASPYGANGQMTMTVHNYRPRQFHRTSNGENPSRGYRDMGSASLAAARPAARPPTRPPARTVTTIPLQPGGLRGKKGKCSNERGITLASNFGKLYERIINERVKHQVQITDAQAGGIPGSAMVDHLIVLKQTLQEITNRKQTAYVVFLDVQKAYDKAWLDAILYVLNKNGVQGKNLNVIKKLNSNLTAGIQTRYGLTKEIPIKDSIRQGGVLSVVCSIRVYGSVLVGLCVPSFSICIPGFSID